MSKLVTAAIEKRTFTLFLTFLLLIGGIASYLQLGRLEDPDFTIKRGLVITPYPGASADEVELEVTDRIETAIQTLPQLDDIYSISRAGLSIVRVDIKEEFWADRLPQVWDQLRNEMDDIRGTLPPGAQTPQVMDDFTFVYGFVLAITADGFSYAELEEYAKDLRREMSVVPGVARAELWGVQPRVIYLDVSTAQLSELGLTPETFVATLLTQNQVVDAGFVELPNSRIRIEVAGEFESPDDIGDLRVRQTLADLTINSLLSMVEPPSRSGVSDEILSLRDVVTVREGYLEPPLQMMRFNGQPALAVSMANVAGGNIIDTGEAISQRLEELLHELPAGIEVHRFAWQSDLVQESITAFSINLAEAVVIVLVVITLAMGLRMGVIIGTSLVLTILATFVVMALMDIALHRVSLGALVVALGMMVDNAIVVADGMMVRLKRGMDPKKAAVEAASLPSLPLLGATIIAVMAFFPVYAAETGAGEYGRSLFVVVGISLIASWVLSVTITPLQCLVMLKPPSTAEAAKDPYGGRVFKGFRTILAGAIRARALTIVGASGLLVISVFGFTKIPQLFFPDSTREQFMVDFWAPEGTPIQTVSARLGLLEDYLAGDDRVLNYATFVGAGGPRFYLPVDPELPYASFAQVVVNTESFEDVGSLIADLDPWVEETYPEAMVRLRPYSVGPSDTWPFELRITGPGEADPATLRRLGEEGMAILHATGMATDVRIDMRQRTPKYVVEFSQDRGRWTSITRDNVGDATMRAFDGLPVGLYREDDTLLPIVLRSIDDERQTAAAQLDVLQVPTILSPQTVPLSQVADSVRLEWEDPLITRFNRRRQVAVQASPDGVTLPTLRAATIEQFEALELPPGYSFFWDGEYFNTVRAQQSLIPGSIPMLAIMAIIVVGLFNALRPPLIIAVAIPFAVIGITAGLLPFGIPFGFMAILGALSLIGMMIKNSIVLLDEINLNLAGGKAPYDAVMDSAVSRLRPVVLAALTTVLGVVPLLQDPFWLSMAVTIMGGLGVGTIVTMFLVPVLYATLFRIPSATPK